MTFTPINAHTTDWDVPLNAALQDLQDQIDATGWQAADHNLDAWTFDPALAQGSGTPTTGVLQLGKIKLGAAASVASIIATVTATGTGLTSGQNLAGLYDSSGTRIATTADQTTAWGTTGAKTMAFTGGPYTLTAGVYYGALLANASTTAPTFLTGHSTSSSTLNIGLTTATSRYLTSGSGLTSLPSSVTLASASASFRAWWFALT